MTESDIHQTFQELIEDPDERFKKFFDFYCDVKINEQFSIDKYLRSGKEMIRMADVYLHEKDYLHAFILYSRYSMYKSSWVFFKRVARVYSPRRILLRRARRICWEMLSLNPFRCATV